MNQLESASNHIDPDMKVDQASTSQVDKILPPKIGKAGKLARLTFATAFAVNSFNLDDIRPTLYPTHNEHFNIATSIGAGPNLGVQFPELRLQPETTQYGAFYYGHRAMDSNSPGITDWYRGITRKMIGTRTHHFYEEQYGPDDDRRIKEDIEQMMYGNLDFAISSWDSNNDARDQFMKHLKALYNTPDWPYGVFSWTFIYEKEGYGDPSKVEIDNDLNHMEEEYFKEPWFLKNEEGQPVLFIYSSDEDGSAYVDKWTRISNERGIEVQLKPRDYDYKPARPVVQSGNSVTIAPQYIREKDPSWHKYHPKRWDRSVAEMITTNADYGLIISWNERYEHTPVKPQRMETDECPTEGNYPLDSSKLETLRRHLPPNPSSQEITPQEPNNEQVVFVRAFTKKTA